MKDGHFVDAYPLHALFRTPVEFLDTVKVFFSILFCFNIKFIRMLFINIYVISPLRLRVTLTLFLPVRSHRQGLQRAWTIQTGSVLACLFISIVYKLHSLGFSLVFLPSMKLHLSCFVGLNAKFSSPFNAAGVTFTGSHITLALPLCICHQQLEP